MENNIKILSAKILKKKDDNISENFNALSQFNCEKINFVIQNKNNKDENKNKKKIKLRNPGIDLMRLIGMYNILLDHLINYGNLCNKYPKFKFQLNLLHVLINWHNNGFALISGIVGYKTNRYSNLLYLWLTVFFYSVGIHLYIKLFIKKYIIRYSISIDCFPLIFHRYWYFTAYFGMYLFLPIINKGISCLTKNEFKLIIISTLGIFVFWKDFKNPKEDVFKMRDGLSILWLLTFYLTGAYIGKYPIKLSGRKKFNFYFICSFIYIFFSYLCVKLSFNELYFGKGYFQNELLLILKGMITRKYNSFLMIAQSIIISLILMQTNFNKFFTKIICFLGPLSFGIYLIHVHPLLINNYLRHIFDDHPKDIYLIFVLFISMMKSLKLFIFCIIVDYLRNLLFKLLRLRNICIFLENKINKIV